jgi:hypothetical protein
MTNGIKIEITEEVGLEGAVVLLMYDVFDDVSG